MSTMDTKQLAFRKAAALLSAIGAEYVIKYGPDFHTSSGVEYALKVKDGTLHGTLAHVEPREPRASWAFTGYAEALKALSPGETWEYTAESKVQACKLQAAVTGTAHKLWGSGNYITTVKEGNVLEILRVA